MAIRGLTAAELLHVAGGEDEIVVTAVKSEGGGGFGGWGEIASGADAVSESFGRAAEISGAVAGVSATGALAQLGLDVPNDAVTAGAAIGAGVAVIGKYAAAGVGALARGMAQK